MAQSQKDMASNNNNNQSGKQFDQDASERKGARNQDGSSDRNLNSRSEKADSTLKAPAREKEGNR